MTWPYVQVWKGKPSEENNIAKARWKKVDVGHVLENSSEENNIAKAGRKQLRQATYEVTRLYGQGTKEHWCL
ncbi:hypothetical protein CEXT_424611 [Caerostris extrusa]|uniref:Uncharacterized protein n=1 Tax=Caerostris extrusa TaxID=172846 RepID=A0AAV4XHE1_CAEEX|nr:hypothetical protein CEXT_424611 [Caerostris extrusa]